MSHNVVLQGIRFTDIATLKKAFDELKNGVSQAKDYQLITERTTIRGWAGAMTTVDMAIKCPGERYDIGFNKMSDGSYAPILENGFAAAGVSTERTAKTVSGAVCGYGHENRALGRLQQRYGVITAENNARKIGSMTRRILAADGQIQLEVLSR